MIKRKYTGAADLNLLQEFNSAAIAETDHCGYLHPGDIPHHIYNGNKHYDPVELITIWEDDHGVAGWLLVDPSHKSFDAQVRPDQRGSDFELEVLEFAFESTVERMQRYKIASDHVYADAFRGDTARAEVLAALGWEPDNESPYVLNRTKLNSIYMPELPDGHSFQSAKGFEDAPALAEVHNAAFSRTNWTPELYRYVMESPGYEPERELVIQAPGGSYTAFCIIWFDHFNRTGLFEPVGTHNDHRRRGFGRALILHGMQKMAEVGMEYATVANFGDNEAARGLYRACGFKPWYLIDGYTRPILP